ncbi:restriction endonuclease S subunit [Gillisia mitskevichiae]|uniref:Restriction endonuclease S subunit n=1 Tax=Gillisia mitskevichiae TaxID=270921 RepID=A0A495PYF0_9FLAO|nr:restriction endonuclease subunit S [Gillisia mitskevichiae]RKS53909.1 restriction endonuclease S subunit [Gillisia mitskevichiae]
MDSILMENKVLNLDKSNWKLAKLGDLANDISKRVDNPSKSEYDRFVGLGNFVSGDIKIRTWETTENLASSARAFQAGDILFARRNAYLRRASLVEFDGCCSGDAFVLRENHNKVVTGFLAFLLNSNALWDFANSNAAGTMSKRVKWRDLEEYEFLLPPKDQQVQLAKLFWAMDNVIEKETEMLLNCETLRDVNRERLYTFGISAMNGLKISTRKGHSGIIPVKWDERKFLEIVKITSGQVDPTDEQFKNLYQIGSERIEPNTGKITEFKTAQELNITSGNFLFTKEHIIYSKIRPYFKKVANPNIMGLCSADIYPLLPNQDIISKEFLFFYLLTEKFTQSILRFQNRTGMPKVNRDELGAIYIPIPKAEEQRKIVKILTGIDNSRNHILSKLATSKALQKSLINQVF